jgi:hypothetical protein
MTHDERQPMTLERFEALLDAHGADTADWPEAERAAAQALLDGDARAQRLHEAASALDALLAEPPHAALQPSPTLRARVAEIPIRHPRVAPAGFGWLRDVMALTFAGAVAMALGVYAGATTESEADGDVVADATDVDLDVAPASDEGADDGWQELAELAFAENLGLEP